MTTPLVVESNFGVALSSSISRNTSGRSPNLGIARPTSLFFVCFFYRSTILVGLSSLCDFFLLLYRVAQNCHPQCRSQDGRKCVANHRGVLEIIKSSMKQATVTFEIISIQHFTNREDIMHSSIIN